jgi:hypothetical protein
MAELPHGIEGCLGLIIKLWLEGSRVVTKYYGH